MRRRPLLLLTILLLPFACHTFALHAQESGSMPPGGAPGGRMHQPPTPAMELERIRQAMQAASLPLTEAQQAALLGILQDRDTAMRALRTSGTSAEAAATQRAQLMAVTEASIHKTLTPAQAQVYDAMRPPRRPGGSEPSGQPTSAPPDGASAPGTQSLIDANTGGNPQSGGF